MIDSSTNLANTSSNKPHNYHEQSQIDQTLRLREVLKTLPPFVKDYFRAMEPKSSARTRINYAYDIRVFFHFLMENNPVYKNYTIDDIDLIEKPEGTFYVFDLEQGDNDVKVTFDSEGNI